MCNWVIPVSGVVLARTSVQHVTPLELQVPELQDQVKEFDIALRERLSDSNFVISGMEESSRFYLPDIYHMEEFADSEGRQFLIKDKTAYSKDDGYVISHNGNKTPRQTTQGWQLSVQWKDRTSDWIALKDLKASYPIEVAEYAVGNQLVEKPAFRWWVKDALRTRNRIISKVKSRYWKITHKFGIEVPKDVTQALAIDSKTRTDFFAQGN
jgi:hypothetical protein